ncbi:hypothetical protein JIP62_06975 [Brevundimonas vitis]|uniref:DUF1376 domain-containing protein n=1 Tax=Brevundimonas vitisensis TaxID=2800818 RepID=A0ABX7BRF7_9CAUL|nr:hypothetical protein [Brevundimonas vitisensis]QQQ19821.1 hypothetical protein JIP62_06975 [Brevundimonas vitisensis]
MTEPLTPADCDLQDFPFMPLHVARLRDSDLASEECPEACWYALLLWAASWHQIPAGSLPDNEAVLTKLIGLGRDVRTFRKHRAGAMRGFVKCSDGRLYHPVVAEQVLEAWERKRQQRWRSELARIKKANQRNNTNYPSPTYEEFLAGVSPEPEPPGPPVVPGDTGACLSGQLLQETGTGTGTGTGTSKEEESFALVADATPAEPEPKPKLDYPQPFEAVWKAYPHVTGRSRKAETLAQWRKLPPADREELPTLIQRFRSRVSEVCGDRGAPCMARWLRDGRHLNWRTQERPDDVSDDVWVQVIDLWRHGEAWPDHLGPTPDEPGCRAPASLIASGGDLAIAA